MKTIEIPLSEYLAYQRLVGYAQSITGEKFITHRRETPYDVCVWHHPVTSSWREGLVQAANACDKKETPP